LDDRCADLGDCEAPKRKAVIEGYDAVGHDIRGISVEADAADLPWIGIASPVVPERDFAAGDEEIDLVDGETQCAIGSNPGALCRRQ
jgi:hypothetical protein